MQPAQIATRRSPHATLLEAFVRQGTIPFCSTCGSLLKPDIVLFGEQLPFNVVFEAEKLLAECDLVLVIGSSLEVSPAASMPVEALNRGARLIIINNEPTYLDERAEVVFHTDVVDTLPCIADEVVECLNKGAPSIRKTDPVFYNATTGCWR